MNIYKLYNTLPNCMCELDFDYKVGVNQSHKKYYDCSRVSCSFDNLENLPLKIQLLYTKKKLPNFILVYYQEKHKLYTILSLIVIVLLIMILKIL